MDSPERYEKLAAICKAITRGEYEQAKAVFDLPFGRQGNQVDVLAEALGMCMRPFNGSSSLPRLSRLRKPKELT